MEKTQQILIKFKKKVVKFKRKMVEINQKIYFYKDILMSMINNLAHCNSLKIFQDSESNNLSILMIVDNYHRHRQILWLEGCYVVYN